MLTCRHTTLIAAVLLQTALMAQSSSVAPQQIAEPPVPPDPLELVTGDAQSVTDVSQRAEIVNLLANAHKNSNVRAQPYDLKTTFTVEGSLSAGQWQMEDMSPSAGLYRWTVQGPDYSAVNLNVNRVFYSSQPATGLPLRLVQVREAIFKTQPIVGPYATLRTASASLNGVDVVCALIEHNAIRASAAVTGPRQWREQEWCVDPKAGTLVTYSEAPGVYVHYDYSKALQFHGKLIANGFTITQAGQTIVEAQTESVTDPPNNPTAFQTTGLNQIGVGAIMSSAWREWMRRQLPEGSQSATAQVVELHAIQSPSGDVSDVEVLASSDSSLNDSAVAFASKSHGMMGQDSQAGATPQSHELVLTIEFVPAQAVPALPE